MAAPDLGAGTRCGHPHEAQQVRSMAWRRRRNTIRAGTIARELSSRVETPEGDAGPEPWSTTILLGDRIPPASE